MKNLLLRIIILFAIIAFAATANSQITIKAGSIVFTQEFNESNKKKAVKTKETFSPEESIFATIYLKLPFIVNSALNYSKQRIVLEVEGQKDKRVYLNLELSENARKKKFVCFPISGPKLDRENDEHMDLIKMITSLENKTYNIRCYMARNKTVEGTFKLDLSGGKGKYGKVMDEIQSEVAAKEAEREKKRLEEKKKREEIERLKKEKIEKYRNAKDAVAINIQNTCKFTAYIRISTGDKETNSKYTVSGNSKATGIKCRPGNVIYMGNKEVHKVSSTSNNKTIKVCPPTPGFTGFKTRWSGDDAWKEWNIFTSGSDGKLKTRWSGDDAWKEWNYSIPGADGTIKTRWSGDDAWKEWNMTGTGTVNIKTRWSGDDAWKEWTISSSKGTINVKTRWSGDDAWKEWTIKGSKGSMEIKTRWSGDDAWKEWTIKDNMPNEDIHMKFAAIFTCLYAGALGHRQ